MRPLIRSVEQLGFVVSDLDACVKLFADKYGVGPWTIVRFGDPGEGPNVIPIENTVLNGRPVGTYAILCAVCDMPGGVQLELIQPLDDKSVFSQYLKEHGPGLQHVSVVTNDGFDDVMAHIQAAGFFETGQIATVDTSETCVFADFRRLLGTYLELHKRPETFALPKITPVFYPEDNRMPEGVTPLFTGIDQLGIVVRDLRGTVRALNDEFGIGPWMLLDFGDCGDGGNFVPLDNGVNNGREIGPFGIHSAICEALNIQLELMQPVHPASCQAEHLAKRGCDVQHLSLVHPQDYDTAAARIHAAGFTKGQTCTVDRVETCLYSDHTELLGVFLELHKRPADFEPPKVRLETYPPDLDIRFGK